MKSFHSWVIMWGRAKIDNRYYNRDIDVIDIMDTI